MLSGHVQGGDYALRPVVHALAGWETAAGGALNVCDDRDSPLPTLSGFATLSNILTFNRRIARATAGPALLQYAAGPVLTKILEICHAPTRLIHVLIDQMR